MISVSKKCSLKDRAILIFGGNGFLGKQLSKSLLSLGCSNVISLDIEHIGIKNVRQISLNLLDANDFEALNGIKNSFIVNLTGQVTKPSNLCLRLNSEGIHNLLDFVEKSNSFLMQISTVGVFGSVAIADENSPHNPETVYSSCKSFAEFSIHSRLSHEKYAIIRLSNLYGYGQEKGIMAYLKRSYHSDKKLFFNNDGSLKRAYLNVDDCARVLADLIVNSSEVLSGSYNFLGNDIFTIYELVTMIEKMGNTSFSTFFEPVKPYDNTDEIISTRWNQLDKPDLQHSLEEYFQHII